MNYDPTKPLTALDAKMMSDMANYEYLRPATDLFIAQAQGLILVAAQSGAVNLSLPFDPTLVNQASIFQYLAVTCGYTTFVDNVSSPNVFNISWDSANRLAISSPINVDTNYGYPAN